MYQQSQEGKMQSAAYKQQAAAAKQNAAMQEHKSDQIAEAYAQKQKALNDKYRAAVGHAKVQAGASGMTADGSFADILSSSADAYEQDTQNLLQNQRNDTWASYVNQVNQINAMNTYNTAAKNNKRQTYWNMAGTLLSGASSIYGQGKKEGIWGSGKKSGSGINLGSVYGYHAPLSNSTINGSIYDFSPKGYFG